MHAHNTLFMTTGKQEQKWKLKYYVKHDYNFVAFHYSSNTRRVAQAADLRLPSLARRGGLGTRLNAKSLTEDTQEREDNVKQRS